MQSSEPGGDAALQPSSRAAVPLVPTSLRAAPGRLTAPTYAAIAKPQSPRKRPRKGTPHRAADDFDSHIEAPAYRYKEGAIASA